MRFVRITQFNRRPSLMDAVVAIRQERAGYAQSLSVEAAYEQAVAEMEIAGEQKKAQDATSKDLR